MATNPIRCFRASVPTAHRHNGRSVCWGAYFSADGSGIQTMLYLLAGLTASGAGAQVYKRYTTSVFHARVVDVVRASLDRRNLKDAKIEDDLLQLVQSHLSDEHNNHHQQ